MARRIVIAVALLVFAADQFSKRWAAQRLIHPPSIVLVPKYIQLTLTTNTGAAFSMFQSAPVILGCVALAAAIGIAVYVWRNRATLPIYSAIALGLTLGGACGNALDRFRLRYVVDFIDVHLGAYQWPIFNVADSMICIGVVMLALRFSLHGHPASKSGDSVNSTAGAAIGATSVEPSAGSAE